MSIRALLSASAREPDAADLLLSAPVPPARTRMIKLVAALTPVGAMIALPLAGLAVLSPGAAAWALLFSAISAASAAFIVLCLSGVGARKDIAKRHAQGVGAMLIEFATQFVWSATAGLAVSASLWALASGAVAACVVGGVWLARGRGEKRAD